MSILLEALRKSEKDQRKVEPPNIHTDVYPPSSSGFFKKGWVLLLIVIILAGALYAWYQYGKTAIALKLPDANASESGKINNETVVESAESDNTGASLAAVTKGVSKRQRTPVENYQQPASTTAEANLLKSTDQATQAANNPAVNKAIANKAAANKAAVDKKAANKAAYKKALARQAAARKATAAKAAGNKPAAGKPETVKKVAAGQKKTRPQLPAPINYWELPDSIRAKVPEMKFTVLVYAEKPADRFVLIDGQRYGQGEQVQPELFVRQIQREGVVFKYRLYQFLVER